MHRHTRKPALLRLAACDAHDGQLPRGDPPARNEQGRWELSLSLLHACLRQGGCNSNCTQVHASSTGRPWVPLFQERGRRLGWCRPVEYAALLAWFNKNMNCSCCLGARLRRCYTESAHADCCVPCCAALRLQACSQHFVTAVLPAWQSAAGVVKSSKGASGECWTCVMG